jgi:hypothetical protein
MALAQAPAKGALTPKARKTEVTKAKQQKKAGKRSKAASPPVEEAQLPPPRPATPEQLPPTRPNVSYSNGQLTILANNSTMSDVLNSVRAQTGAQFEMSGVSTGDRVYAKLGPGAPKDILAALLDGSRFNFAILGSPTDPRAVERVVLMPKAGGASSVAMSAPAVAAQPQMPQPGGQPQANQEQPNEEEMQPAEEEAPPAEEQQQQPQQQQQQQQQGQPGQVKTPEQLLQELQQMQQQQQNQQNPQQNPQMQQQDPNAQPQIPEREIPDEQPR